jgi:peptidoglycan/LPS O-acetylase OafA/YrhL
MGVLRLFLAVSVLATHLGHGRGVLGLSLLNGEFAVECFFIISGFYMALVLNEKYNYPGSYWAFIQQRFLRLYPLYFIVGILILAVEGLITYSTAHPCGVYEMWTKEPRSVTFLSVCYYGLVNLVILGQDSLWFLYQDNFSGQLYVAAHQVPHATRCADYLVNVPTWTLAVEMTFYLVAPFLVRKSVKVQAAFMLASLALRSCLYLATDHESSAQWTYFFSPSDLFFFMAGSLGYHFYKTHRAEFEKFAATHSWMFWVFGALIIDQGRLPLKDYFPYLFVPFAIVMVPLLFAYTRKNKRDRLIGELSYPYYLVHFHVIAVAEFFMGGKFNSIFGPLCAVLSFGVAFCLYRWIEIRTEHYRERLFQKTRFSGNRQAAILSPCVSTDLQV